MDAVAIPASSSRFRRRWDFTPSPRTRPSGTGTAYRVRVGADSPDPFRPSLPSVLSSPPSWRMERETPSRSRWTIPMKASPLTPSWRRVTRGKRGSTRRRKRPNGSSGSRGPSSSSSGQGGSGKEQCECGTEPATLGSQGEIFILVFFERRIESIFKLCWHSRALTRVECALAA